MNIWQEIQSGLTTDKGSRLAIIASRAAQNATTATETEDIESAIGWSIVAALLYLSAEVCEFREGK